MFFLRIPCIHLMIYLAECTVLSYAGYNHLKLLFRLLFALKVDDQLRVSKAITQIGGAPAVMCMTKILRRVLQQTAFINPMFYFPGCSLHIFDPPKVTDVYQKILKSDDTFLNAQLKMCYLKVRINVYEEN